MPRRLSRPVSASWSARWRSWSSRRAALGDVLDLDEHVDGVPSSSRTMVARSETQTGWPSAWTMRSSVAMPSSASSDRRRPRRRAPRRRDAAAPRGAARPARAAERPVMVASAALTRSTLPSTPTSAMPIGARSKAISKRSLGLAAGALGAALVGDVARDEDDPLDAAVVRAHGRALDDDGAPRDGPEVSTLPSCPASALARIGSVAASSSAGTISDTWRPTIAAPSMPALCRCAPSSSRQRRSRSKRPTDAPGRCCSTSR